MDALLAGFAGAMNLTTVWYVALGVFVGLAVGAIPGLSAPMAIALGVPLTYAMAPVTAIGFLVGINKGGFYGGALSDSRMLNNSFIIEKATGKIVWRIGPDYSIAALLHLGTIIGQHHVHMIPKGLPGAGNILIFDNGGMAGYGDSSPSCFNGAYNACRHYSRVLEINPVTLEIAWSYNDLREFHISALNRFFSAICSGMQRLPNGNTLICESTCGRLFEVTPSGEIVWEYLDPSGFLFRAHRYPYDWVPLSRPEEKAVLPPNNRRLHVENCVLAPDDVDFFSNQPQKMDPIVSALPSR